MTELPPPMAQPDMNQPDLNQLGMAQPPITQPGLAHANMTQPPMPAAAPPPPTAGAAIPVWPPADATIVANNVSKAFGQLIAVSGISFAVTPGVTALLGPNGAGKSTMLRMLSGQLGTTAGEVWVAGGNPRSDSEARGRIGLVPQQDGVFDRELTLNVVKLAAILSNVDEPEARARWALGLVEMDPDLERPIGNFSKGMRQRVKIAQALVHDPDVFMMDEPLNGLDPKQRGQMVSLFHKLGDMGKTVLISSHVLEEVERFGSHIIVIAKGRLAAQGDFRAIRGLMDDQPLRIRVTASNITEVSAELIRSGVVQGCTVTGPNESEILTSNILQFRRDIAKVCQTADSRLEGIAPLDDDLESVFRYLTGGRG